MKNILHYFKVLLSVFAGILFLFNFNACKKDDTPTVDSCCIVKPPEYQWLLKDIEFSTFYGLGRYNQTRHSFEYNSSNKLAVHKEITDLINPAHPPSRIDSFYYNNKQQLILINSQDIIRPDIVRPSNSYKETFSYDASDRKKYSLKYLLSATNQYQLSDSTDYQYIDSTIWKITYHLTTATRDSAFFTYNQKKNIVKFKLVGFAIQELELYDNEATPGSYTGLDAFELDPYPVVYNWGIEFMLMMQAPVLSKNNYMRMRPVNAEEGTDYTVYYGSIDSIPSFIGTHLIPEDAEFSQYYIYTPIK